MSKIVFFVIVPILVIVGAISFSILENTNFMSGSRTQTLDQALRNAVEKNISDPYLPSEYTATLDIDDMVQLGFGRRSADNYRLNWLINNTYFITFVGFDKNEPANYIGFIHNIYMPGLSSSPADTASVFLSKVPLDGWRITGVKDNGSFTSQVSTVIWQERDNNLYLEVLSLSYDKPQGGFIPDLALTDVTVIRYQSLTPENPQYDNLKEFQLAAHKLYGP